MSRPPDYFAAHPEAGQRLQAACRRWLDTPFRQRCAVPGPGGGIDCAGFLGQVFLELGALTEPISIPPYALNHAEHSELSLFHAWLEQPAVRERVRLLDWDEAALIGDIVFPIVGRCEHHAGLYDSPFVWHVARPTGVCRQTLGQLRLHRSRYRLLAL